ncbi:MAG: hypothetical protein ACKER6_01145 [Candidatus Hodgkinia cicadicola]
MRLSNKGSLNMHPPHGGSAPSHKRAKTAPIPLLNRNDQCKPRPHMGPFSSVPALNATF